MKANNILERAEKYRTLGRFDEKSGITFLNDAIFEVVKRQNLQMKEMYEGDLSEPIVLTARVIKFESAESDLDKDKHRFRLMNDGSFLLYILNEEDGSFHEVKEDSEIGVQKITFRFVGFNLISNAESDVLIPEEYESALVFYIRSKMLQEHDDLEKAQYFFQQFLKELATKSTSKRTVVSKPSEYSLR